MSQRIKIAINGFGRIGRLTMNALMQNANFEIVAINDLADCKTLAHLLKYDSTYGVSSRVISAEGNFIKVDDSFIEVFSERNPENLPWARLNIDLVIEATGIFTDSLSLSKHISAGAKKVLLSAPAKDDILTVVLGVNENRISKNDIFVSNASCTTNCLAPLIKVLQDNFGVDKGFMTTVHAYTSDQNLLDSSHKDLRRARAAARSIIPTSTGAATAVGLVLPELQGKLFGLAFRVPVENGSVVDFTATLNRKVSVDEVNNAMKNASDTYLKGILQYTEDPIVSIDIIRNKHSCIFDSQLTIVNENLIKVVAWYDNEGAYAQRMADIARIMCSKG